MKKIVLAAILLCTMIFALPLSGCKKDVNAIGKFGKTTGSLYLYKDLAIQDVTVRAFDTEKYSPEEYRGYLDNQVSEYNRSVPFVPGNSSKRGSAEPDYTAPVTVVKCEAADGVINQQLLYANATDYCQYMAKDGGLAELGGTFVKTGTLSSVDTDVLRTVFTAPDGSVLDVQALCSGKEASSYRYILADFPCVIYGDGNVTGFARGMNYSKENSCISTGSAELSIVIYK